MVRRVRDILGEDIKWFTLATASTNTDTTIDVTDGTDWDEGGILEWQDDGDQAYVIGRSGNTLTTLRSVNGTTGAAHSSAAATKDPVYPYIKVTDAIDAVIQTLWPWAWKTVEATITPSASTKFYNLGNDVIDLVRAFQEDTQSPANVNYFGTRGSGHPVGLAKNANSLTGITFDQAAYFPNGVFHVSQPIYVQYRALITDTVSSTNYSDLTEGALTEALCWGAAARLVRGQSAVRLRNDARQWNNSVDLEAVSQTSDFFYAEFRRLLMDNYDHLLRTNPPMRNWER